MTLRWDCNKRGCYKDRLPDWGVFDDCFPRGIKVSDIDGMVEINSSFLMFEWKGKGVSIPEGQRRMLQRFANRDNDDAVVCLRGTPDDLQWLVFPVAAGPTPRGWCDVAIDEVKSWVCRWSISSDGLWIPADKAARDPGPAGAEQTAAGPGTTQGRVTRGFG